MAFTKNPLQDGTKTKLKDYSVDLENRIGNIDKTDVGLGDVLNIRQASIRRATNTNGEVTLEIEPNYSSHFLVGTWGGGLRFFAIVGRSADGDVGITHVVNPLSTIQFSISGNNLTINTNGRWTVISLVQIV